MLAPLLFVLLLVYAQEGTFEKYCYPSTAERVQAELTFEAIQVPSDKVIPEGSCMTIQMSDHRRELIQHYLLSQSAARLVFSSATSKKEPCKLTIEKIITNEEKEASLSADSNPEVNSRIEKKEQKEETQITTIDRFEVEVDRNLIEGSCQFLTPDSYRITLKIKKNFIPSPHPQLPPPDQQRMSLQTQIDLMRGQKQEIGSVLKELNQSKGVIHSNPSLKGEIETAKARETVFLGIQ